jgi:hypothetical protein
LYSYLSKLGKTFINANYDEWLDEEILPPTTDVGAEAGGSADVAPRARTVYFKPEDLTAANLNRQDVVILDDQAETQNAAATYSRIQFDSFPGVTSRSATILS